MRIGLCPLWIGSASHSGSGYPVQQRSGFEGRKLVIRERGDGPLSKVYINQSGISPKILPMTMKAWPTAIASPQRGLPGKGFLAPMNDVVLAPCYRRGWPAISTQRARKVAKGGVCYVRRAELLRSGFPAPAHRRREVFRVDLAKRGLR